MKHTTRLLHIAAIVLSSAASVAPAQQARPALVYTETITPNRSATREWTGSAWSSATNGNTHSSPVAWVDLVNSPSSSGRALMTLCSDRSLALSNWNGSTWNASTTMTSDAGATTSKVFAMAYEGSSGQLLTVYRKASSSTIFYRTYIDAIASEQSFSMGLASSPTWMEVAARPRSDEIVLVVRSGSSLYASVWNGASWANTVTLETATPTAGRPFSVEYMSQSGKAMVVWTASTGAPKYRVWDGNTLAWSAVSSLPAIAGGVPAGWIKLTSNPTIASNELLVSIIGTNKQINLNNWTGTSWGTNLIAETTAALSTDRRVDIAYQPDGAGAVAVWHKSGQNALRYRTWKASAWGAQTTGTDMGSESQDIQLVPGEEPTQVLMAVRRRGAASYSDYLAYSSGGAVNLTGTVNGPIAQGGLPLPAPPVATPGATSVVLANNETRSLAPGNYANLETGNSCTINFSAGTYVFTYFFARNNGAVFNFDTSAGPVTFILTNGNFDGKNDMAFNNLGSNQVNIHVLNGYFDSKNNNFGNNFALLVYNGSIVFGNNLNFNGFLYASGNITGSGVISMPTSGPWAHGPGQMSSVLFTAGVPGPRLDLGTSAGGVSHSESALVGKSPPSSMRVVRWREIGPDE